MGLSPSTQMIRCQWTSTNCKPFSLIHIWIFLLISSLSFSPLTHSGNSIFNNPRKSHTVRKGQKSKREGERSSTLTSNSYLKHRHHPCWPSPLPFVCPSLSTSPPPPLTSDSPTKINLPFFICIQNCYSHVNLLSESKQIPVFVCSGHVKFCFRFKLVRHYYREPRRIHISSEKRWFNRSSTKMPAKKVCIVGVLKSSFPKKHHCFGFILIGSLHCQCETYTVGLVSRLTGIVTSHRFGSESHPCLHWRIGYLGSQCRWSVLWKCLTSWCWPGARPACSIECWPVHIRPMHHREQSVRIWNEGHYYWHPESHA